MSRRDFFQIFCMFYLQCITRKCAKEKKTLISNVIPEQVQEASLLQIDCQMIVCFCWVKKTPMIEMREMPRKKAIIPPISATNWNRNLCKIPPEKCYLDEWLWPILYGCEVHAGHGKPKPRLNKFSLIPVEPENNCIESPAGGERVPQPLFHRV